MSGRIEVLSARLKEVKAERSDLAKQRATLWNEQAQLEQDLIDLLSEIGIDAAKTSIGTVRVTETIQPAVDDWQEVYDYIVEQNQPYLFYKRLNPAGYRELLDNGIIIPGTKPETVFGIGLTKK
jgi:hypothetical protein